jgi:ribosomal protein S6
MNTLNNQYINPFAHDPRGKKWTQEKIKEIIDLFEIHKTVFRVAKILGKTELTIKTILKANGIATPTRKQFVTSFWKHYEDFLNPEIQQKIVNDYISGLSAKEIGKQFGVSSVSIRKIIRQHKAQRNLPKHINKLNNNKDYILDLHENGKQITDIAREFNCSDDCMREFLIKNTNYVVRKKACDPIPLEDIEKIYKLHHEQNYTLKQIGNLYDCTGPCVAAFFDKHNIPRRTKKESVRLKNHEEANLLKKSKNLRRRKPYTLPSGNIVKVMGYEDAFLDFVFNNNIFKEDEIVYMVSSIPYTQDNVKRKYIPDFYIPKLNLIVEIKSWYTLKLGGGVRNLLCKRKGVLNAGFNFCVIMDNKFDSFLAKITKESLK